MTFAGDDLYPDVVVKTAALMHTLVMNHAFVDGNKRVGAMAAELFLTINGYGLDADDDDLEALALGVASGEMAVEALAIWFRQRARPLEG